MVFSGYMPSSWIAKSVVKNLPAIPGSGRYPRGGHSNPFQCSCLPNPKDRGTWWATIHKVTESQTQLK